MTTNGTEPEHICANCHSGIIVPTFFTCNKQYDKWGCRHESITKQEPDELVHHLYLVHATKHCEYWQKR